MRTSPPRPQSLRGHTSVPFEVFVAAFSVLPFFVLAYFYEALPGRVPLFMHLNGEVAVWAEKSVLSVFRVPLMAVDTQLVCLLLKYGVVQSERAAPPAANEAEAQHRRRYVGLNAAVCDWLRCLVAFKMSAASLDTIFLSVERFKPFARPAFAVTAAAAALSVAAGLLYAYRLLALRRGAAATTRAATADRPVDARRVYGRVFYFNPSDASMFVRKYVLNFANKWAWVFIACVVAYPLLVFSPA